MTMKKSVYLSAGALSMALVSMSCSGTGGSIIAAGASSIASLPSTTGAVTGSSSSWVSQTGVKTAAATTGTKLSAVSTANLYNGKSRAACEVSRIIRDVYRDGARPDKILCYVGVVDKKGLFSSNTNIYDGVDHAFSLKVNGNEQLRFKLNIVKDSTGITSFKGYTCEGNQGSTTMTQDEYVSVSIANGTATVTAVDTFANSGNTNATRATTTGSFAGGVWGTKTISVQNTGTFTYQGTTNTNSHSVTVSQGASSVVMSAWQKGSFGAQNYETDLYAAVQGLNMSKLTTFALGDGSVLMTGTYNGSTFANAASASWNGDTLAPVIPASSGSLFTTASAGTIPTSSNITVGFKTGETWDCTTTASVDMSTLFAGGTGSQPTDPDMLACDTKYGFTDTNWTDCSAGL